MDAGACGTVALASADSCASRTDAVPTVGTPIGTPEQGHHPVASVAMSGIYSEVIWLSSSRTYFALRLRRIEWFVLYTWATNFQP
jgi:hypothetical protein